MIQSVPHTFSCRGATLIGILDMPEEESCRAVLLVVGGPQYRVGSHRQFRLLSHTLADAGFPVFRFDHRGIGDSEGETSFESLDPDIEAAIDALQEKLPAITEIVIWGLCDAASAAMMYAHTDDRVKGLVLLNPWVRSNQGLARSYMEKYYSSKLRRRDFWKRLFGGDVDIIASGKSLIANGLAAFLPDKLAAGQQECGFDGPHDMPFQQRMKEGLARYRGHALFILSGNDLTADEFDRLVSSNSQWRRIFKRPAVVTKKLQDANHTFSTAAWRNQVSAWTLEWLKSW